MGFPSYIAANSIYPQLPYYRLQHAIPDCRRWVKPAPICCLRSRSVLRDLDHDEGQSHAFAAASDVRQYRLNTTNYGNSAGNFSFSREHFRARRQQLVFDGCRRAGSRDVSTRPAHQRQLTTSTLAVPIINTIPPGSCRTIGGRDRNLTLNLGLRFDHDNPYHEKYGRTLNGFDSTDPSPLGGGRNRELQQESHPADPGRQLQCHRADPRFATPGNNAIYNTTSHLFSPRVGVAWTPDQAERQDRRARADSASSFRR